MVGLAAAVPAVAEILTANQRTINPASGVAVAALWIGAAAGAGALIGGLAGRAARILRLPPDDGAAFVAGAACGQLFLPPWGALFGAATTLLRVLRRMTMRRFPRLDLFAPVAPALVTGWLLFDRPFPLSPFPGPDRPLAAVVPAPGAVPVTVSVHAGAEFPDVPAVHVPLRDLASALPGRRAALWTGRAPARTRAGTGTPRRVPGGGGLSWIPDRPGPRAIARLLPAGSPDDPRFAPRAPLWRVAEAAGIPVLRAPPAPGDPPIFLRILESERAPDRTTAEALRGGGAWIDVRLDDGGDRVALSGAGISVAPGAPEATLMDVAPTAMHLLGLPVPRTGDGRVLLELLDPEALGGRPIRYRNNPGTRRASTASRKRRSFRMGSNDSSVRKRPVQLGSSSSARSRRGTAAAASPSLAATAAFTYQAPA
jgi:hypothetical protein